MPQYLAHKRRGAVVQRQVFNFRLVRELVNTLCIPSLTLRGFNFILDKERGKDNFVKIIRCVKITRYFVLGFVGF